MVGPESRFPGTSRGAAASLEEMRMRLPVLMGSFAAVAAAAFAVATGSSSGEVGVVVETVSPGEAAALAGLRIGDVLLRWESAGSGPPAGGVFTSPFDLRPVLMAQDAAGPVALEIERDGRTVRITVPTSNWGLQTRPRFSGDDLDRYVDAEKTAGAGDRAGAAGILLDIAERAERGNASPEHVAWLLQRAARHIGEAGRWEEAAPIVDRAAGLAAEAGRLDLVWALRNAEGDLLLRASRYEEAARAYEEAIAAQERLDPESLALVSSLTGLGRVAQSREDLDAAAEHFTRSLAMNERLAPGSLSVAAGLQNLAVNAQARERYAEAVELYRRALQIRERLAPGTLMVAMILHNLGHLEFQRGDLDASDRYNRMALEIRERLDPGGLDVANSLNGIANLMSERGDQAEAERLTRRSLEIRERLAPGSLVVATSLGNLGRLAMLRRDFVTAEGLYRRSLEIRERLAPGGAAVASTVLQLGIVAELSRGDYAEAEALFRRALAIHERIAPGGLAVAMCLNAVGVSAMHRGDLASAEEPLHRALEIRERLAPGTLDVASSLHNLGDLAFLLGDLDKARDLFERALGIRKRLAPRSFAEADSAAGLARVHRRAGRPDAALAGLLAAIEALEVQEESLGGIQEDRIEFRARNMEVYRDAIDLLVESGRLSEALHLLERSRARTLAALLAERDAFLADEAPPELEGERRRAAADYDRTQEAVARMSPERDADRIQEHLDRLHALRRRLGEIGETIRRQSPRLASLRYPKPLDLAGVRRALDPGTVLLAYSVAESAARLFVADATGLARVEALSISRAGLDAQVREFRRSVEGSAAGGAAAEEARRRGADLYRLLAAPAAPEIRRARRLLIVPDGPLHALPFAALVRTEGRGEYLIEWKPLHVVVSVTVYAELRKGAARRTAREGPVLVAFGDPRFPGAAGGAAPAGPGEKASAIRAVLPSWRDEIRPLAASREEVESIGGLYGSEALLLLGAAATEVRAKQAGRGPRLLHFATHALVDERSPLDSAIVLSLPESPEQPGQNGLLQAWEVFEEMRIDADLVTLSACETALGKELAGEGMIGLTRAFQYAGARSVLASLWNVADRSTAGLMKRFYGHLRSGKPKDEALRAAQIDLIRARRPQGGEDGAESPRGVGRLAKGPPPGPRASPFHWAAFVLNGDWR
jgi:CHAT domain-containing protein/Tfp pilus assembly protein PilF